MCLMVQLGLTSSRFCRCLCLGLGPGGGHPLRLPLFLSGGLFPVVLGNVVEVREVARGHGVR